MAWGARAHAHIIFYYFDFISHAYPSLNAPSPLPSASSTLPCTMWEHGWFLLSLLLMMTLLNEPQNPEPASFAVVVGCGFASELHRGLCDVWCDESALDRIIIDGGPRGEWVGIAFDFRFLISSLSPSHFVFPSLSLATSAAVAAPVACRLPQYVVLCLTATLGKWHDRVAWCCTWIK